ncbi:hypothetical protein ACHAWF_012204 [Thalassiosira exigua]
MFEWWAFELIALLCGTFPDQGEAIAAIGSNAIVYQISCLVYMIFLWISVAATVRIGHALGAGDEHRAKMASYVALVLVSSRHPLYNSFHYYWTEGEASSFYFTKDNDLISKASDLFVIVALYQLPDAINARHLSGNWETVLLAAKLNFVAFYVIGIRLGCTLGFQRGMGVSGLWIGITAGLCFAAAINTIFLLKCDWYQFAFARARVLCLAATHGPSAADAGFLAALPAAAQAHEAIRRGGGGGLILRVRIQVDPHHHSVGNAVLRDQHPMALAEPPDAGAVHVPLSGHLAAELGPPVAGVRGLLGGLGPARLRELLAPPKSEGGADAGYAAGLGSDVDLLCALHSGKRAVARLQISEEKGVRAHRSDCVSMGGRAVASVHAGRQQSRGCQHQ